MVYGTPFCLKTNASGRFLASTFVVSRSPASMVVAAGSFLLQIPQSSVVIDGDYENSPFGAVDGRCVVVFSNHDGRPNARLCTWSTDAELKGLGVDETQHEVRERMWLVTTEPVEAGQELRFNYSAGSLDYWKTVNPNPND